MILCIACTAWLGACEDSSAGGESSRETGEAGAGAGPAREAGVDAPHDADPRDDAGPLASDSGAAREAGATLDARAPAHDLDAATLGGGALDAALTDAALSDAAHEDAALDAAVSQPMERTRDFVVGTRRIEIQSDGGRVLPVQLWYPAQDDAAAQAEAGLAIERFEPEGPRRTLLKGLIEGARKGCPNLTMHAAPDTPPYARSAPFPLVIYSHHFNGARFSMFSIAERLAREGMVVAAPDHVGGSLFEREGVLGDALRQFNEAFVRTRVADLRRVLDVLLDVNAQQVPEGLRGRLDPARVGAIGHSLGAITNGAFSVEDTRVRASAYLAAPPRPALIDLVADLPPIARYRTPALYLTCHEDASAELMGGATEIAAAFEGQSPAATWIDVRDTGHFSFADVLGFAPELEEGCGTGTRVSNGETFTYLEPQRARAIASHYVALFFAAELDGAARDTLSAAEPPELVTVKQRPTKGQGSSP